jgi:hypothetical protein
VTQASPGLPRGFYRVAQVLSATGESAPPELRERFEGRAFRPTELEQRGVRIAGGQAWFTANAQDWRLVLDPPFGSNS